MTHSISTALCLTILTATLNAADQSPTLDPSTHAGDGTKLNPLEQAFQKTMSGCVMTGVFTSDNRPNAKPASEKYTISKAGKLYGNTWLLVTRVEYGGKNVTVPIPLTVLWAGDTPVITLTDLNIPKLGTFTARVLIYRGHYAGTWNHGKQAGGKLFGTIAPLKSDEPKE